MEKKFSEYQPSLMVTCLLSYYHVLSKGEGLMSENILLLTSRLIYNFPEIQNKVPIKGYKLSKFVNQKFGILAKFVQFLKL